MRTTSISSAETRSATSEYKKQPSEVAIALEANEPKRTGRARKEQKKSGRSYRASLVEWRREPPLAAGSLLNDPRRAKKVVAEGKLSSRTDPAQSPMNDPSMATSNGVQVGEEERQSLPTRQQSV